MAAKPATTPITTGKAQLATAYGVSLKTLRKWLKDAGCPLPENRRLLQPAEVQQIYDALGKPTGE